MTTRPLQPHSAGCGCILCEFARWSKRKTATTPPPNGYKAPTQD